MDKYFQFERNDRYTFELMMENEKPVIFVKVYAGIFDPYSEESIGFKLKGEDAYELLQDVRDFFEGIMLEYDTYSRAESLTLD